MLGDKNLLEMLHIESMDWCPDCVEYTAYSCFRKNLDYLGCILGNLRQLFDDFFTFGVSFLDAESGSILKAD